MEHGKPLRNVVQPLCTTVKQPMKHSVTLGLLNFRAFLPLCYQCNRISRCGRDAEAEAEAAGADKDMRRNFRKNK